MKRSKNQAVYKFLPGMWVSEKSESDGGRTVTAKITNWNYQNMECIYESFVNNEIKRQIRLFANRGGDTSSFSLNDNIQSFCIVEPVCNEGFPDIVGQLSPLVFYCSSCHSSFELLNASQVDKYTWKCKKCGKMSVKQLQMAYTCACGYSQPIKIPYVKGISDFYYRPNETAYKMFYKSGNMTKPAEFVQICPTCSARLVPDNAISGKNYKPFTLRIINLVDDKSGTFFEKSIEAQKIIVAKWFGKLTQKNYEYILDNVELVFSQNMRNDAQRKEKEEYVRALIGIGLVKQEDFETAVNSMLANDANKVSVENYVSNCDAIFSKKKSEDVNKYEEWIRHYSFKLMQYNTIKYAKRIITLEDSIRRQIDMEFIDLPEEVYKINKKLGIINMQVSCDIQIINCTYGYTRRVSDPKNNQNKNCRLKLCAFDKAKNSNANLVYGAKLDTEGILFEISQRRIIEWLFNNKVIREEQLPDLDDEFAIKQWFGEYVHSDTISIFGEVDSAEAITKNVFALLHSMAHAFIKTAGEMSGLSETSLTEIIIVESASIFIYAQTSQGIPLGALSGMAETSYVKFLKKVFEDSRNCIFDPICAEKETACLACLILPEVSCNHFNSELGRKYLYSIENDNISSVGFWER